MCSDVEANLLSNSFCVVESSRQLRDVIRDRIAWFVEMGGSPVSEIGGETYESVYRSWFVFPGLSQEKLNELGEDDV